MALRLCTKFVAIALLLTLVPLAIVGAIGFGLGRKGVQDHTNAHLRSVVLLREEALGDWLLLQRQMMRRHLLDETSQTNIRVLLDEPPSSASSQSAAEHFSDYLAPLIGPSSPFVDVLLVDHGGAVRFTLAGTVVEGSTEAASLPGSSELGSGSVAGVGQVLVLSEPIPGATGRLLGILDAHALVAFAMPDDGMGPTGRIYIYLPGVALITGEGLAAVQGTPDWLAGALSLDTEMGTFQAPNAQEMVGRAVQVQGTPWTLVAGIPSVDAFADVRRMGMLIVASMVVLGAIAGALAYAMGRRITDPIGALWEGVRRVGEGDLDTRVAVRSTDEIADLATAFNQMTADLASTRNSLDRERRMLAGLQDRMDEGLIALDADRRIIYANGAAQRLWAIADPKFQGETIDEALEATSDQVESLQVVSDFQRSIVERHDHASFAVTLLKPATRHLDVSVFDVPFQEGGNLTGVLFRDITDERDLAKRKDVFVSVASHELRTPVTTILGFSELLMNRQVTAEVQREWMQRIHDDGKRLAGIVEDMLSLSRIQSGTLSLQIEPLNVEPYIRSAVEAVALDYPEHRYRIDLPNRLGFAAADADKLTQVMINLVSNAAKYSVKPDEIRIAARRDGERIEFSVRDNGIGISPESQTRLFSAFFRVQRTETETIRGTGLGLHIVKNLVEMMGGAIWVRSALNQGSTFSFSLPVAETVRDTPRALEAKT